MDRYERAVGLRTASMNPPGQGPFAGTAFAADQNRHIAGRRSQGIVQLAAHRRILRSQIGFGHDPADLVFQGIDVPQQPAVLTHLGQKTVQLIDRGGLDQVVERTLLHRLDGLPAGGHGGQCNQSQPGRRSQQFGNQLKRFAARGDVDKRQLERPLAGQR